MITEQTKITRITFKKDGVTYVAVESGHLVYGSVIVALLKRKVGKHAYVRHEHTVR